MAWLVHTDTGYHMIIPRRFLPPTAMLAAFEAAARTGSFTQAAAELNFTQSAISRQIRALEDRLGAELFVRDRQKVILTGAGLSYAREIREALRHIGAASLAIKANPHVMTLNLAMPPTFGGRWLMPRIQSFFSGNPDVTINFSSRTTIFDFQSESFDCAIYFGHPEWSGAESLPLMGETVAPMGSPTLAATHSFDNPEDLLSAPLLILSSRVDSWERWFLANGVSYDPITGPVFDQFETMACAARAGLGIALLPCFLFAEEVARGDLVPVLDTVTPSEDHYHFVWPQGRRDNPAMALFRDWIMREISAEPPVFSQAATDPFPDESRKRIR
jgi:DNA-binding transcriptional LysR family regulator